VVIMTLFTTISFVCDALSIYLVTALISFFVWGMSELFRHKRSIDCKELRDGLQRTYPHVFTMKAVNDPPEYLQKYLHPKLIRSRDEVLWSLLVSLSTALLSSVAFKAQGIEGLRSVIQIGITLLLVITLHLEINFIRDDVRRGWSAYLLVLSIDILLALNGSDHS